MLVTFLGNSLCDERLPIDIKTYMVVVTSPHHNQYGVTTQATSMSLGVKYVFVKTFGRLRPSFACFNQCAFDDRISWPASYPFIIR